MEDYNLNEIGKRRKAARKAKRKPRMTWPRRLGLGKPRFQNGNADSNNLVSSISSTSVGQDRREYCGKLIRELHDVLDNIL